MRKVWSFLFVAVWVTILPYLGFSYYWKDILFTLTGLILIVLSCLLYRKYKKINKDRTFDNFFENTNFKEIEKEIENI